MSRTRANLLLCSALWLVVACRGSASKAFEVAGSAPSFVGLVETQACIVSASDVGALTCLGLKGDTVWHADVCRPVRQRPAAIGGSLWVACDDGEWTALDVKTGRARWKLTGRRIPALPLVSDGVHGAIASAGGAFEVVDETGATLWEGKGAARLWAGFETIVASDEHGLTAYQAATGDPLWSDDKPAVGLAGNDDVVVVARVSGDLAAFDRVSGASRWGVTLGAFTPDTLAVDDKAVTVGLASASLVELSALDGIEKSRVTLPGPLAAPVRYGVAVLQGREGCAQVLATATTVCADHQLRGSAVVRDGVLMLGPRDGRVLGFKLKER